MEPVVYDFAINENGTFADLLSGARALMPSGYYALTAGLFSRSPANIERVKAELVAGNVYINRSCTGAVVGRHPFGGFKMSGVGRDGGDYGLEAYSELQSIVWTG